MKTVFIFLLVLLSANAKALDRQEMIDYFLELEEIETVATNIMESLRDELVASDKKITNANFDQLYGDVFEDYREAYIQANTKAYEVYTDEQIVDLYNFYESDFGRWYRQEERDFGPRVRANMKDATEALKNGIASQRRKKRKSK